MNSVCKKTFLIEVKTRLDYMMIFYHFLEGRVEAETDSTLQSKSWIVV